MATIKYFGLYAIVDRARRTHRKEFERLRALQLQACEIGFISVSVEEIMRMEHDKYCFSEQTEELALLSRREKSGDVKTLFETDRVARDLVRVLCSRIGNCGTSVYGDGYVSREQGIVFPEKTDERVTATLDRLVDSGLVKRIYLKGGGQEYCLQGERRCILPENLQTCKVALVIEPYKELRQGILNMLSPFKEERPLYRVRV